MSSVEWDSIVCHKGTVRRPVGGTVLMLALAGLASAQSTGWRRVGNSAVDLLLASPATGPVEKVWFSVSGGTLYARPGTGRGVETAECEGWVRSQNTVEPAIPAAPAVARTPENGALLVAAGFGRVYAAGRQLYRSDDGGRSWANLTAFKTESVVGFGQRSVAVSPDNPDQIVVANDFGVWRSMDGGLCWAGLNELLPNLRVQRILATPGGTAGTRRGRHRGGGAALPPGATVWQPVDDRTTAGDAVRLKAYSERAGMAVTAYGRIGTTVYAGTADGRILISRDDGASFAATDTGRASGPVEGIFVDPARPDVALAALGGSNVPHVLRTTNAGRFWDALDSNLPNAAAHAVTGERAAGAVYVATDQGVFWAQADLDNAGTPNVNWIKLSDNLPATGATDVRLDPAGIQLYAAMDGYGVYATAAPHRLRNLRLVNAADFSTRAAAPGSLLSVIGGGVNGGRGGETGYPGAGGGG